MCNSVIFGPSLSLHAYTHTNIIFFCPKSVPRPTVILVNVCIDILIYILVCVCVFVCLYQPNTTQKFVFFFFLFRIFSVVLYTIIIYDYTYIFVAHSPHLYTVKHHDVYYIYAYVLRILYYTHIFILLILYVHFSIHICNVHFFFRTYKYIKFIYV